MLGRHDVATRIQGEACILKVTALAVLIFTVGLVGGGDGAKPVGEIQQRTHIPCAGAIRVGHNVLPTWWLLAIDGAAARLAGGALQDLCEEGQVDDAAFTWTQYHPSPGRVEAVAGTDILAASSSSVGVLQAQYRYISSSVVGAIICAEGTPWLCDWALATVQCESGGNPTAWATEIVEVFIDGVWVWVRYYFHGLWQIASTSPDPGPLADPVYNTERAVWKYINEGTGAWPGCP